MIVGICLGSKMPVQEKRMFFDLLLTLSCCSYHSMFASHARPPNQKSRKLLAVLEIGFT